MHNSCRLQSTCCGTIFRPAKAHLRRPVFRPFCSMANLEPKIQSQALHLRRRFRLASRVLRCVPCENLQGDEPFRLQASVRIPSIYISLHTSALQASPTVICGVRLREVVMSDLSERNYWLLWSKTLNTFLQTICTILNYSWLSRENIFPATSGGRSMR